MIKKSQEIRKKRRRNIEQKKRKKERRGLENFPSNKIIK